MAEQAQNTEPRKKPRLALLIATGFGLGYIPKAPGTAGSLLGVVLANLPVFVLVLTLGPHGYAGIGFEFPELNLFGGITIPVDPFIWFHILTAFGLGIIGTWSAGKAARYLSQPDPQSVIVDEISGQHLALLLGGFFPLATGHGMWMWSQHPLALLSPALNWKYFLLGFILFRVFDIWKPWPVRNAEKLPGGWGIMADDWVAGLYAAAGLWIARAMGL